MMEKAFSDLHKHYGDQQWWPGESPFEIMIGTLLAQNNSVKTAIQATQALATKYVLSAEKLASLNLDELIQPLTSLTNPSLKAQYLIRFSEWFIEKGKLEGLAGIDTDTLRDELLQWEDIQPETVDRLLLYGLNRPVFVIDDYTRRLFFRLGMINGNERYDELKHVIELTLQWDPEVFNEFHALIDRHAKDHCLPDPKCEGCPLDPICPNEE